ncbi:MAG: response regulator transcription factor [Lachnospiraceae bacterium]|nr:response regulator transcription factor [Lachnospiraceae bacterium]
MPRILIADDEPDIARLIARYASREGYEVLSVESGDAAVAACRKQDFDIIVMDVMMPGTDGFSACEQIRRFKNIPVLMLSARGTEFDKLYGFEVGVDDYVTKPFSPKELLARINAILRRSGTPAAEETVLRSGGLVVDTLGHSVTIDGVRTDLTVKEYAVLTFLMKNKGIVLSRDRILDAVWGYESFGEDRTVDWQIKLLRGKLGPYRDNIHTIRGVGYRFED